MKVDTAAVLANECDVLGILNFNQANQDNYGWNIIGHDDEMMQQDTSLSDLDHVIMTQYTLVSAISKVPVVKLMQTQPKGFNSSGEFEAESYRQTLETLQEQVTPMLERHHELVMRSDIAPEFNIQPFEIKATFAPLDAITEKELSEINLNKANASSALIQSGALSPDHERQRLINDEDSGYNGIELEEEDQDEIDLREAAQKIENELEGEEESGEVQTF